jgi:hypothetical protein
LDIQDARALPPAAGDSTSRASLQIELRAAERQTVVVFRDLLLRWLTDRTAPLSQSFGPPDRLFLDEPEPAGDDSEAALRLSAGWPAAPDAHAAAADPIAAAAPVPSRAQFVFFPEPPEAMPPLFRNVPALCGVEPGEADRSQRRLRLGTPAHVVLTRQALALLRTAGVQLRAVARDAAADLRGPSPFGLPQQTTALALGVMAFGVSVFAGTVYMWKDDSVRYRTPAAASSYEAQVLPARNVLPPSAGVRMATAVTPGPDAAGASAQVPPPAARTVSGTAAAAVTAAPVSAGRHPEMPARAAAEPTVVKAADREGPPAHAAPRRISGALLVRSEPRGAQVSINGVVHGRTPLVIRGLDAGSRVVRLDLPGYERWSWAVGVVANKQTPVTVKLQPEHDAGTD